LIKLTILDWLPAANPPNILSTAFLLAVVKGEIVKSNP